MLHICRRSPRARRFDWFGQPNLEQGFGESPLTSTTAPERQGASRWRSVSSAFATMALAALSQHVAAQFAVVDSGSAIYDLPIPVPSGIAGMAPNVGLAYVGSGRSGPVGYGWTLQGVSTISRCPGNVAIDGSAARSPRLSPDDKLCLDGQRLIQVNASGAPVNFPQSGDSRGLSPGSREYRTETDTYARIRAYGVAGGVDTNGPAYFKVWTKGGQIYEYGINGNSTSSSAITAQGTTVVAAWAVSRVSDLRGNFVDYQYQQRDVSWGSGSTSGSPTPGREWNLIEIRYTGNGAQAPSSKVVFSYSERPALAPAGKPHDRAQGLPRG